MESIQFTHELNPKHLNSLKKLMDASTLSKHFSRIS